MGYASLADIKSDEDSPVLAYTGQIQDKARSALTLTHELRVVSRHLVDEVTDLALNAVLNELTSTIAQIMLDDTSIVVELESTDDTISFDHALLEQLLLILASAAREALRRGGVATFRTRNDSPTPTEMKSNDSLCLEIQVAPDTTVEDVGLVGIDTVKRIICQHGGALIVNAPPVDGIMFQLHFKTTKT